MIFSLAPINPNVNGIYYEKNSYKKSIKRYLKSKSENILYSNYTNATQSHNARSAEPIGIIKNIDLENRQIDTDNSH